MAWSVLRLLGSRRTWFVAVMAVISFIVAWHVGAYRRSMLMAYLDHACGHYEVKTHGYVDESTFEYARLLYQKFGVKPNLFGGCCVDPTTADYEAGYNSVSERLLNEKHGKDIFAECGAAARPMVVHRTK